MIYPSTAIFTVILAILTFVLPKRYFIASLIIGVCFIPFDQRIIIVDLDFTPLRILVVFAALRMFFRREQISIRWNLFDKMVFGWAICGTVVYIIQRADTGAVINRSGVLFDIIGLYWLFRQNLRSWENVRFVVKVLSISALISALLVIVERVTQYNPFILFGTVATGFHRGRYRCRGSFEHAIILGLFWANLVPIFVGYAMANGSKRFYWWTVTAACILIVFATGSSTPITTLFWILLLLSLFRYRHYGRQMAFGFLGTILALHIVMSKPVWHLISRIRIISGSTGWYRYHLIDQAIKHFGEWALLGTRSTAHWGLVDITNNYIRQGINGGFVTLLILIIILVMAVKTCGRYSLLNLSRGKQWLGWAFCVSVLGHAMSFFGVSYFGKIPMLLYLTFAIVGMIYHMSHNLITINRPTESEIPLRR
jgi:hypothetical protein